MICGILIPSIGNCYYFTPYGRTDKIPIAFKEIKNMEIKNNQLTIEVPEGMEIDLENSDLANCIIRFKRKSLTYNDISRALTTITYTGFSIYSDYIDRFKAIAQLMNIAKYYNGDWKPDWKHKSIKYYIYFDNNHNKYDINYNDAYCRNVIYFKNSKDAQAVIDNPNFRDILDAIYKN